MPRAQGRAGAAMARTAGMPRAQGSAGAAMTRTAGMPRGGVRWGGASSLCWAVPGPSRVCPDANRYEAPPPRCSWLLRRVKSPRPGSSWENALALRRENFPPIISPRIPLRFAWCSRRPATGCARRRRTAARQEPVRTGWREPGTGRIIDPQFAHSTACWPESSGFPDSNRQTCATIRTTGFRSCRQSNCLEKVTCWTASARCKR